MDPPSLETGVTPIELRSWGMDAARSYSPPRPQPRSSTKKMPAVTTVVTTGPSPPPEPKVPRSNRGWRIISSSLPSPSVLANELHVARFVGDDGCCAVSCNHEMPRNSENGDALADGPRRAVDHGDRTTVGAGHPQLLGVGSEGEPESTWNRDRIPP